MRRLLIIIAAANVAIPVLLAQSPAIQSVTPQALAPGRTTEIVLSGDNLAAVAQLWSSFPARILPGSPSVAESDKAAFRVEIAANSAPGIGAIRFVGSNGVSGYHLVMVDPLPSISESATNAAVASAQALRLPVAVDGDCLELKSDFYKFTARKGQRLCVEVVAQRLGSLLDPRVCLLDEKGRELLAVDDTPGLGADCSFDYKVPKAGEYLLELRDTKYEGGAKHRYRLRVGVSDLAPLPFLGEAISTELREAGFSPLTSCAELEPNDQPHQAARFSLPVVIAGGFGKAGDRDFYEFEAQKDQRVLVRGQSRSLGSGCDLFLRIQDTNGNKIADAGVGGADEGSITNTFKKAGTYRLLVEELNHLGGAGLTYHIDVRPLPPGFALSVDTASVSAPAGNSFEIEVKPLRRDYDGPIQLQLIGLGTGFAITNDVITAKTNIMKLKVMIPAGLQVGEFHHFAVTGRARVGDKNIEVRASTLPALRRLFPELPFPPAPLDGLIGLGISVPKK